MIGNWNRHAFSYIFNSFFIVNLCKIFVHLSVLHRLLSNAILHITKIIDIFKTKHLYNKLCHSNYLLLASISKVYFDFTCIWAKRSNTTDTCCMIWTALMVFRIKLICLCPLLYSSTFFFLLFEHFLTMISCTMYSNTYTTLTM